MRYASLRNSSRTEERFCGWKFVWVSYFFSKSFSREVRSDIAQWLHLKNEGEWVSGNSFGKLLSVPSLIFIERKDTWSHQSS